MAAQPQSGKYRHEDRSSPAAKAVTAKVRGGDKTGHELNVLASVYKYVLNRSGGSGVAERAETRPR